MQIKNLQINIFNGSIHTKTNVRSAQTAEVATICRLFLSFYLPCETVFLLVFYYLIRHATIKIDAAHGSCH